MVAIVTTSDLQRDLGTVMNKSSKGTVIVTKRGKAKVVMIPYFENNEAALDRYFEDLEMFQNREALKARYKAADESGDSGVFL